jgi:hypothetical protein
MVEWLWCFIQTARANETLAFFVHFSSHPRLNSARLSLSRVVFLSGSFECIYSPLLLTNINFYLLLPSFFSVLINWLTSLLSVNHSTAPLPSDDDHHHHHHHKYHHSFKHSKQREEKENEKY